MHRSSVHCFSFESHVRFFCRGLLSSQQLNALKRFSDRKNLLIPDGTKSVIWPLSLLIGPYEIFVRILIPLCAPIMITVAIFTFMFYWNDFQGPLIYLRSDNKFTLALGILSLRVAYASKWNYIMAASLVMVLPAVVLFAIGQRYFIEGIVLTGIKG